MDDKKVTDVKKDETAKTTKRRRKIMENTPIENEKVESEVTEPTLEKEVLQTEGEESAEEQITSLDILWNRVFGELDQWARHADFRDDVFLKEATHFAESIQRNQENIKSVREQFNKTNNSQIGKKQQEKNF
jgi:hypothetical protein